MLGKPEQSLETNRQLAQLPCDAATLRLDPPLASSNYILIRGRVQLPPARPRRQWPFRRQAADPAGPACATRLRMRLPDHEDVHDVTLGPSGEFEARVAAHLPRLRSTHRRVCFTLECNGQRIEQYAPLFMPSPGAAIGVIVLAIDGAEARDHSTPGSHSSGLSEASRELANLFRRRGHGGEANPVYYVGVPRDGGGDYLHRASGWPDGLRLCDGEPPSPARAAVEQAAAIERLLELYADELEFVIVADTGRHSVAVLQALSRLQPGTANLRSVFLNDTRAVARGVRLQCEEPPGIRGLDLPIVLCRTLDDARRAAVVTGMLRPASAGREETVRPVQRLAATQARVTRYPLVFCHGMLGYSVLRLHDVDLDNYFNGLREFLTERGFRVLMPQIGRTHGIADRAEQLRRAIGRWTSEPVNLIGHSMGGLDARFLISKLDMADRVASLTTVASPHHGSYFADWFVDGFDSKLPLLRSLEQFGLQVEGFRDCTRAACRAFNEMTPDSPKVRYLSYSAFQVARKIPPVLRRSHSLIARAEGANDGLVSAASAHWGEHRATLRADHLSLVGERGPEFFDHLAFFQRVVEDLIRLGF